MLDAVTTAIGTVLDWVKLTLDALLTETGELYSLLPLFAVGVAISAILLGVKITKSFIWGS